MVDSERPDWPGLSWPKLVAVSRALHTALANVPVPPWRSARRARNRPPDLRGPLTTPVPPWPPAGHKPRA